MVLLLRQGTTGPEKGPDFEEFTKSLDDVQIGFLVTLLKHAAEQDYGVVEELYMWVANTWMNFTDQRRLEAAGIVNERFFTEKARIRYLEEMEAARKAGLSAEEAGMFEGEDAIDKPS
jgi:hypothetical protein